MAGYPPYGGGNYNNPPPIGFEMPNYGAPQGNLAYPPSQAGTAYPQSEQLYNPPQVAPTSYQAPYQPPQQNYGDYPAPQTAQPSHTNHGDSMNREGIQNLPPVGFEGVTDKEKPDTTSSSGVKLDERENSNERLRPHSGVSTGSGAYRVKEKTKHSDTLYFKDGKRRIDYVLAYDACEGKSEEWKEKREEKRNVFEANLVEAGLQLEREDLEASSTNKTYYVKVHAPWRVLARGAEEMLMKMPIRENDMDYYRSWTEKCFDFINIRNPFELREEDLPEQPNYFTCAFRQDRLEKFIIPDDREKFFTTAQRGRIVYRILGKTRYGEKKSQIGIERLLGNQSYNAAYPLHEMLEHNKFQMVKYFYFVGPFKMDHSILTHQPENERQLINSRPIILLYNTWVKPSRWYKEQPLDLIRDYFGEKIGIYFAWLGFYTEMLIPAAIIGWICVIYGLAKLSSYIPVSEVCESTTEYPMCPRCDEKCNFWPLNSTCTYSKAAYVFDNDFTVIFAIFMSLWATMFLEFWKRKQAEIAYEWDLFGFEDEEERPRPEYEARATSTKINPITRVEEPHFSVGRRVPGYVCGCSFVVFMLSLVIIAVFGVVVYRVAVSAVLAVNFSRDPDDIGYINMVTAGTAALINLVIILFLNKVYEYLAMVITRWEMPRTQTKFEDSYTFKMYMFQFMNFYSSLFYIAFAKLNPGRPGAYNRILNFRAEECNPAGCITELLIQLAVIMVGKQIFNNLLELLLPKILNWWRQRGNKEQPDLTNYARWELDYTLTAYPPHGLFYEYLEMVIQFGFITLFVTAFPLGPFFALINNLVEIRLDAYKYTSVFRRPMAARAQDIGVWYAILNFITKISVVVNGFTIAFVSEFVPRLYYEWAVSDDGSLTGFVNNSLSCFDVNYFYNRTNTEFIDQMIRSNNDSCGLGAPMCRFRGYYERPPPGSSGDFDYSFSKAHWHIMAAKLFFLIAFLHVVFGVKALLAWMIPDVPKEVSNQIKRENFLAREALRSNEPPASTVTSPAVARSSVPPNKEQNVRTNLDI